MKTKSKALLLSLCAVLLVVASVMGTMAYLTDSAKVENTFSVGKVKIDLDETDVDDSTPNADRDKANSYLLVPGQEYTKDPIVYVRADSEDSWVFVKVVNGIAAYEGTPTIASQITTNGWTALDETEYPGVYYKTYTKNAAEVQYKVFEMFTIADNAMWTDNATANVNVKAYAIQKAGTGTPAEAWAKVSAQYQNP